MRRRALQSVTASVARESGWIHLFPFDKLVKLYSLDLIDQAAEDSEGVTIKPVIRMEHDQPAEGSRASRATRGLMGAGIHRLAAAQPVASRNPDT